MGKDNREQQLQAVANNARQAYLRSNSPFVTQPMSDITAHFQNNYENAASGQEQDYNNIMSGYRDWTSNMGDLTRQIDARPSPRFTFERVNAERPAELDESYGYLREAMPGYREFAKTGGYSDTDIQELRARGISPIRAAYANSQMQLDRSRSLGGAGGSPNYIAATARMQRELPGQLADATTNVNARLAEDIRQGKLAGLAGISGIGSTMGGLSSAEAQRMLSAALANQNADIQTQGMTENAYNQWLNQRMQSRGMSLQGLNAQTNLYGTTPARAALFGNQALQARGQDQQYQLGLLDLMNRNAGQQEPGTPWWRTALQVAGTAAPYIGAATHAGTAAGLTATGASLAGGTALPGAGTFAGTGGSSAAGGAGALGSIGSAALTYGSGVGIPLAILAGINSYTGGDSPYSRRSWAFGNEPGILDDYSAEQDRQKAQELLELYGPDNQQYISFITSHPWAA